MYRKIIILVCSILLIPFAANAADTLSFDIDWLYYEDEYRIFDMDFNQGTEDSFGSLDLSGTWSSKTGSGINPQMKFHPTDGDGNFFNINTTTGRYRVSLPKPLDSLPSMTTANSTDWNSVSHYIDEGTEIDYRGSNASANIEYVKLAYNSDKSQMKIYFKVTDETDLSNIGFRFVFFPIYNRGSYNHNSYMEDNYPSGAPKYIIVDLDEITTTSGTVEKFKIADGGTKIQISDTLASCIRSGDTFEITFSIVKNNETVIDLSAEAYLMEGVSFSDPNGTPQIQDSFGPRLLYTRAGGEFTNTTGVSFDGQNASTDYTLATRLRNFDAFTSDSLNSFTIGFFNGPNVTITGKWIQGFYNGHLYDNTFILEAGVTDATGSINVEDSVSVPNVSPESAVVDLALKTAENGKELNFYYRITTEGNEVASITEMDNTWTLFNSYTITGAEYFYGYPNSKGVIFVGSDAMSFPATTPSWGNEDNNAEIVDTDMETESSDELENEYNLTDFQPIAPKELVEVLCDPGEKVVLRYLINGFHKELSKLRLYKLKNGNHLKFKYYVADPDPDTIESGDWWITAYGDEPDDAISGQGELQKGEQYVLYFVVQDNDGEFDLDDTEGRILDPTVIGEFSGSSDSAGSSISSGGSGGGGGCFISVIMNR